MRANSTALTVILSITACPTLALEPCNATVETAVRSASLAFPGRVVKAEEVERSGPTRAVVVATVVPYSCIKGNACRGGRPLRVRYLFADLERLDVQFIVGADYLFAFRQEPRGRDILFDTSFRKNCTDMAYVIGAELSDWTDPEEARVLTNVWLNVSQIVTLRDLRTWASSR